MTIQALGLRPVKPIPPTLNPTARGVAFTPELTSDVFTPSASAQSGIRFGYAPLREAEERIMGMAIDGDMDTHHKKALAQLFKVPGVNVLARLPKRKFSRADGQYFHEAPDASAHNLLGLGWIRAAIDRKKIMMPHWMSLKKRWLPPLPARTVSKPWVKLCLIR